MSLRLYIIIGCLLAFAVSACSDSAGRSLPDDTLVRIGDSEIRGLDPQKNSDLASVRVAMDQFEGLTRFDAHGAAVPGLAESWEISKDGLKWTFILRTGLQFSDGKPISATLFPKIWQRLQDPKTASPHDALFGNIESITASDSHTVTVKLKQPSPQLPDLLAHPALAALPMHIIDAQGDAWTSQRPLVTSGPYRLSEWRLNDMLVLEANPQWHEGAPPIARVIWRPVEDRLSAMRLFMGGGADITSDYLESRHEWLSERLGEQVRGGPYLGSYYFTMNTRKTPFDDVRVRRALSMAVDRQWLSEKLSMLHQPPAWGVVPPALYGGEEVKPEWADWSLERRRSEARKLLQQAGYDEAHQLQFDIRINSSVEHRRMAVALSAMWQELGVNARILNSEAALHFASMRRGDFEMARSGWIADFPGAENFLAVHTKEAEASNYSGYANPAYDRALQQAMQEPDPAKRAEKMQAAERILIADAPVIPLNYYVSRALVGPRVSGWQNNAANIHPSATLSLKAKNDE